MASLQLSQLVSRKSSASGLSQPFTDTGGLVGRQAHASVNLTVHVTTHSLWHNCVLLLSQTETR